MPRELLIIGSSGLSKEVALVARRIDPTGVRWPKLGYVTHLREELGTRMPFGEVCELDENLLERREPVDVAIGVGHPHVRRKVIERLSANPALNFPNLIHPGVEIVEGLVTLGRGNVITQNVSLTCDIRIGDFNLFNLNSTLGHDAVIGNGNVINPGCNISGRVQIGDWCLLGTGCRILETLQIVSDVTIGSGAVVTRSIMEAGTYVGMPARRLPS